MIPDRDPRQEAPLAIYVLAALVYAGIAIAVRLARVGIIKPPPKKYENNYRGLPF